MSQNVWATIMPFGPVTNFLLAQKIFSGQPKAGAHFRYGVVIKFNTCISKQLYKETLVTKAVTISPYLSRPS